MPVHLDRRLPPLRSARTLAQRDDSLHPDCNHLDILGQHLQLLATGQSVLKPVYDHASGRLLRPVVVDPADYIIVEGLLPLHTNLCRACFDLAVYLDPDDNVRRDWKTQRDCASRGYTPIRC